MATRLTNFNNPQEMTVWVGGPEDANRLIICTGEALTNAYSGTNGNVTNAYTFLVGPVLTRRQFVRAVVSAGMTRNEFGTSMIQGPISAGWTVQSVDADWDDESGQVEVRVEVRVLGSGAAAASLNGISYNVSILAAVPEA